MDGEYQKATRDRHVLQEHDHLHLVREIIVKQNSGQQTKTGEQQRRDAGLPAEAIARSWEPEVLAFETVRQKFLSYSL